MKRAILLALLLAGCQTAEERLAADDRQCQSYGTQKGDTAYIRCRSDLDRNRSEVKAAQGFGTSGGLVGAIERNR